MAQQEARLCPPLGACSFEVMSLLQHCTAEQHTSPALLFFFISFYSRAPHLAHQPRLELQVQRRVGGQRGRVVDLEASVGRGQELHGRTEEDLAGPQFPPQYLRWVCYNSVGGADQELAPAQAEAGGGGHDD